LRTALKTCGGLRTFGASGLVLFPLPNPSFHLACYGWLRQPAQAAEPKR
jgi:hypothetical protein